MTKTRRSNQWGMAMSAMMSLASASPGAIRVEDPRCEYRVNPVGIEGARPRLCWIITIDRRAEIQTAYQILVASSENLLKQDQGDLWDSGKVASGRQNQIEYAGKALEPRARCFWKVRVWSATGTPGAADQPEGEPTA